MSLHFCCSFFLGLNSLSLKSYQLKWCSEIINVNSLHHCCSHECCGKFNVKNQSLGPKTKALGVFLVFYEYVLGQHKEKLCLKSIGKTMIDWGMAFLHHNRDRILGKQTIMWLKISLLCISTSRVIMPMSYNWNICVLRALHCFLNLVLQVQSSQQ